MNESIALQPATLETWLKAKSAEWQQIAAEKKLVMAHRFFARLSDELTPADPDLDYQRICSWMDECCQQLPEIAHAAGLCIQSAGVDAYSSRELKKAENLLRFVAKHYSSNNLAYMIRRGEVENPAQHTPLDVLNMLRSSVQSKDAFAIVNTALTLALRLGTNEDWTLADSLINEIEMADAINPLNWWVNVAKQGDVEGVLVAYLLQHHHKAFDSSLGTPMLLRWYLTCRLPSFPDWLQYPETVTLDDIMSNMTAALYDDFLQEYLLQAPRDRKHACELLNAILQWDEYRLYEALLEDYAPFLTAAERSELRQRWRSKFDLPMPGSDDDLA